MIAVQIRFVFPLRKRTETRAQHIFCHRERLLNTQNRNSALGPLMERRVLEGCARLQLGLPWLNPDYKAARKATPKLSTQITAFQFWELLELVSELK